MEPSEISDDELLRAFNLIRPRSWPPSIEVNLMVPIRAKIIRAKALQLRTQPPARLPEKEPNLQVKPPAPAPYVPPPLDRKRLAAGERDDD